MKNLWNSKVRKDKGKENRRNKINRKEQRKELKLKKKSEMKFRQKKWKDVKWLNLILNLFKIVAN